MDRRHWIIQLENWKSRIQYLLNDYFWPFRDCLKEWMEESTTPGPMRTYKGPPHNPSQSLSQSPRLLLSSFNFLNLNIKFLVFPNFLFSNSLFPELLFLILISKVFCHLPVQVFIFWYSKDYNVNFISPTSCFVIAFSVFVVIITFFIIGN